MTIANTPSSIPVAVFAHNEADHIRSCLESLKAAADGETLELFILANGCTDATEAIVEAYAASHPGVRLVPIARGDKANAWNVYVHDIAPERDLHVFVDGDVEVMPGAIRRLKAALEANPEAHAAAGFPCVGRSLESARKTMLEEHALAGNLYALRGEFVGRLRRTGVRLPVGIVREDGLVAALVKWDLDPRFPWDRRRIAPCPDATFRFQSLSLFRWSDWRFQWRRRIRYAVGYLENRMLGPILKEQGIAGMPATVDELYARSGVRVRADGRGLEAVFRRIALSRIRRQHTLQSTSAGSRQD